MTDLQLVPGTFRDFRATVRFHLGKLSRDLNKDAVVQFDGVTLVMDTVPYPYPELRSAIKSGWLAVVGGSISDYLPKSAALRTRPTMDGSKKASSMEVQHDETYVGSARPVQATTTDGVRLESKGFNSTLVRDTEGDGRSVGSAIRKAADPVAKASTASSEGVAVAKVRTAPKQSFSVDGSTTMEATDAAPVEAPRNPTRTAAAAPKAQDDGRREGQSSEGGKIVANVKSPSKRKVVVTDANAADAEIRKLDTTQRTVLTPKGSRDIAALVGDALEDIVPANEPENRGRYIAEQAKANHANRLRQAMAEAEDEDHPPVMAPVKVPANKPVVARPPKSIEDAVINGDDLELAPGVRWNKKLHWKSRVKLALQYKDQPKIMALIRGHEVPTVVKQIDVALQMGSSAD